MMPPALRTLAYYALVLAVIAVAVRFKQSSWAGYVLTASVGLLILSLAGRLRRWREAKQPPPANERLVLEAQGKLVGESFSAKRAFFADEYEDLGIHYYIELADGRVLHLSGQYLYEYEESEEPELSAPWSRRFPCTEFTVLRHRDQGHVIDILCAGQPLEHEVKARGLTKKEWLLAPSDGQVFGDRSYEDIKAERMA